MQDQPSRPFICNFTTNEHEVGCAHHDWSNARVQPERRLICPECQFDGGHSPVCTTRLAQLYRSVSELLSKVYGWYNAEVSLEDVQKQQEQMILDLQKIKGLL